MAKILDRGAAVDDFGNVLNPYEKTIDYVVRRITTKKEIKTIGDKVWLITASTGSGKSTVIPPYLWRHEKKGLIVCLQPKIYNTISIPEQIQRYNPDFIIGENLGFSTSIKKVMIKDKGVMFMTIDTLLAQMKMWDEHKFMSRYTYIIVDEVHERNIGLDLLLFKLKIMMTRNLKGVCPTIILMSATFDVPKFSKFFETKNTLIVLGITFPIQDIYLNTPSQDVWKESAKLAIKIHTENEDPEPLRDILIFVPGRGQAKEISAVVNTLIKDIKRPLVVIEAFSDTVSEVKPLIEAPNPDRRLIVATTVVQTGVTIDTLKYVIETGWGNIMEYDPVTNASSLLVKPIDRGSATQRRGRVGRKAPGICYRMYTESTFNKMQGNELPEMLKKEVSEAILYILIDRFEFNMVNFEDIIKRRDDHAKEQMTLVRRGVKSNSLDNIDMLDPPSGESILRGMTILHQMGVIDKDNMPTIDGLMMYKMTRLPMESRKMLLSSVVFDVSFKDLNIHAWCLANANDFPKDKPLYNTYKREELFKDLDWGDKFHPPILDNSIHLFLTYKVFRKKMKKGVLYCQKWCESIGLNYHTMVMVISLAYEVIKLVGDRAGFNYDSSTKFSFKKAVMEYNRTNDHKAYLDFIKRFKLCVYQGYKANLAIMHEKGYRTAAGNNIRIKGSTAKHVLYYSSILREQGGRIDLSGEYYSVMSGYVGVDENFY